MFNASDEQNDRIESINIHDLQVSSMMIGEPKKSTNEASFIFPFPLSLSLSLLSFSVKIPFNAFGLCLGSRASVSSEEESSFLRDDFFSVSFVVVGVVLFISFNG
jgi:hypothetical protein